MKRFRERKLLRWLPAQQAHLPQKAASQAVFFFWGRCVRASTGLARSWCKWATAVLIGHEGDTGGHRRAVAELGFEFR